MTGTQEDLAAVISTLKNTPGDQIEALVDANNDELTAHLNSFNGEWGDDLLAAFRDAQVMIGCVSTIMAKSGLSE